MREIPVPGAEVDRCVLATDVDAELGLITCLGSDWPDGQTFHPHGGVAQGFLLIPVSGVDDAEGRVREQVGEEKIGGNGRNGTSKRDMIRYGMILRHETLDNLEPHVQSSRVKRPRKNARMRACGKVFSVQSPRDTGVRLKVAELSVCETQQINDDDLVRRVEASCAPNCVQPDRDRKKTVWKAEQSW